MGWNFFAINEGGWDIGSEHNVFQMLYVNDICVEQLRSIPLIFTLRYKFKRIFRDYQDKISTRVSGRVILLLYLTFVLTPLARIRRFHRLQAGWLNKKVL